MDWSASHTAKDGYELVQFYRRLGRWGGDLLDEENENDMQAPPILAEYAERVLGVVFDDRLSVGAGFRSLGLGETRVNATNAKGTRRPTEQGILALARNREDFCFSSRTISQSDATRNDFYRHNRKRRENYN